MVNWKIVAPILAAVVIIAIVIIAIVIHRNNDRKRKSKQTFASDRSFVQPLSRRERYIKGKSGSLNNFINNYIDVESGSWN